MNAEGVTGERAWSSLLAWAWLGLALLWLAGFAYVAASGIRGWLLVGWAFAAGTSIGVSVMYRREARRPA